ncbi:MAG: hypothetical protein UT09_C0011G0012 [Parcubacteria group bacterium GW2011_GWF2_38_8]|nr:MAG: hypothetical protein UT09_C0011G0012 [Parcubacteria group bacterium GW2011_GWF2_38_8]
MNSNTGQKGFTLIEALVGAAVFVLIALSGWMPYQPRERK